MSEPDLAKPCTLVHLNGTHKVIDGMDGASYDGELKAGKRHGCGKCFKVVGHSSCQLVYEGQWMNDRRCGRGMALSHDGHELSIFEGQWTTLPPPDGDPQPYLGCHDTGYKCVGRKTPMGMNGTVEQGTWHDFELQSPQEPCSTTRRFRFRTPGQ